MQKEKIPHIILVEDDPFLAQLLRRSLERKGFVIDHAQDGKEALQKIQNTESDLVLLDLCLPQQSGFDTMKLLNESHKEKKERPPIIVISNLSSKEDIERAKQLGAVGYFVKTDISNDQITEKVGEFLGRGKGDPADL